MNNLENKSSNENAKGLKWKYILNFLLQDFFGVRHFVMDELCKMDPY